jgi:putative tricarboxylic transport membrane protein
VLHGLQPGPLILTQNQVEIYGLVWALTASCLIASLIGLLIVRWLALVTLVPATTLVPIVLSVALVGSWAVDQTIENAILCGVFALLGYAMIRLEYPRLPIVISLVLGAGIERNFHQSIAMSNGAWSIFLFRPLSLVLVLLIVAALFTAPARAILRRARKRHQAGKFA